MNISDLIRQQINQAQPPVEIAPDIQARLLLDAFAEHQTVHKLQPGQLVQHKPALRGQFRYPCKDTPGIVCQVFDEPLHHPSIDWKHPLFGRGADVLLLVIDSDGEIMTTLHNSRFLEPCAGKALDVIVD